jgi:hypothetical protein
LNINELSYEQILELAQDTKTDSVTLEQVSQWPLLNNENMHVVISEETLLIELAKHKNTSKETLEFLAKTFTIYLIDDFILNLLNNPKSSPLVLDQLVLQGEDLECFEEVKSAVAVHPNASSEILFFLSYDDDWDVQCNATDNPNYEPIDDETLMSLASSEYEEIRYLVATNEETPVEVLRKLSTDFDFIRRACAENPNCDQELLKIFLNDEDEFVREAAENQLN